MNDSKKTVLLLFGGRSSEYEVSLSSAAGAIANIDRVRYNVLLCGITREGQMFLFEDDPAMIPADMWESGAITPLYIDFSAGDIAVLRDGGMEHIHIDAVLPMIHGKYCEDGTMQGLFAVAGIPVAGCDCQASAVCMDKAVAKTIVTAETDVRVADALVVRVSDIRDEDDLTRIRRAAEEKLRYPMFIKPSRAGSSVGVTKVKGADSFDAAVRAAFGEDTKILIEECIVGRETEVAVLEEHGLITVAHPAEIDTGSAEFYDYETKYISDASSFYLPARLSEAAQDEVRRQAEAVFRALDCRGLARVDFFSLADGTFVFNEINTLPGFTPISMYPKMMIHEGISYGELLTRLIESAG